MNELPRDVIRALEMAEAHVREDEVPTALQLAFEYSMQMKYVTRVRKTGPRPPQPKSSKKPVSELQPGDILFESGRALKVKSAGNAPVGVIPSGIHVHVAGMEPMIYQVRAKVTVLDGPIRVPETWQEYVLTEPGVNQLTWHRLTAKNTTVRSSEQSDQPELSEPLPPEGAKFAPVDVPAVFREGGKPDGAVLTTPYLAKSSDWLLAGPYLTKHYGPGKELTTFIKVGRAKAYLFREVLALRHQKTQQEAQREASTRRRFRPRAT